MDEDGPSVIMHVNGYPLFRITVDGEIVPPDGEPPRKAIAEAIVDMEARVATDRYVDQTALVLSRALLRLVLRIEELEAEVDRLSQHQGG